MSKNCLEKSMGRARLVWEASFLIFFYYAYVLMTSMMMTMSLMDNDNAIFVLFLCLHSTTTVTMYLDPVGSCPGVRTKNSRPTDLQGLRRLPEKERRGFTVEYSTVLLCTEYGR